ncbi:MAG: RNA polymerase sigma factor RpoH [Gammaproteobacteria bacterium]|jgi:RNA polymerase sigma-32 factor|nr:RNA polymerase sigma factor RpoH [Gammaproteobacteria bacterium]MBT3490476.1 RNA polymerase sigma factor RpoH [Gammaproteobacteria bacterium]MBT3717593.1 RNA polymerase sigma factor RpoH [Gammaproteobacteria bacterium]MBT3845786.1 RNA polymerase sigma factor RpoH [Gammaproteobacteria bacterium]MBT3893606.1 RNA polymerase sigma factor RpoH [Gammaproteobacteria bacterium]
MSYALTTGPVTQLPVVATHSIDAYLQDLRKFPLLSEEEEQTLAIRFHQEGDLEAARRLVLSNLRFVAHIARGYLGYGLPLADLVQEGNLGLMKAVRRFDPEKKVRLVSFAVHWIRAEIHEYVIRNWSIVKVATTKAQRKLFFNLRRTKKRLGWFSHREVETVASELGVKPETVLEMERRLSCQDTSFDPPANCDEEESFSPAAYLQAPDLSPEEHIETRDWREQSTQQMRNALTTLDERSKQIITQRWLCEEKSTLHELAADYGVSAERIRQLEQAALKKLKSSILL